MQYGHFTFSVIFTDCTFSENFNVNDIEMKHLFENRENEGRGGG